jgi:septum formation protein
MDKINRLSLRESLKTIGAFPKCQILGEALSLWNFLKAVTMEPIILASGSLRRQEYFRLLGLPFSIMPPSIDENYDDYTDPGEAAKALSAMKVQKIMDLFKGGSSPWICGVDTIVTTGGKVFGKPKDREDAKGTLASIQGRDHEVITAVSLFNSKEKTMDTRAVSSIVSFAPLSEYELEWYLNTGEWQGSAGGYRIQAMGACFISGIKGSYSNVVGLPLHEFYVMLNENGYAYGA